MIRKKILLLDLLILLLFSSCIADSIQGNDNNQENNNFETLKIIENTSVCNEMPFIYSETKLYEIDVNDSEENYSIIVNYSSYEYENYLHGNQKAGINIEIPIVSGLNNQDKINNILIKEIYESEKINLAPDTIARSKVNIQFNNLDLISIVNNKYYDNTNAVHPVTASYGLNIDLRKGKIVHLSDFMEVDERLLYKTDDNPTTMEDHYKSDIRLPYHKFIDAFAIYKDEEDKDVYHWRSIDDVLEDLLGHEGGRCWYITENREIVFSYLDKWISIPYKNLSDIIHPEYYTILNNYE